jgi:hypothetical protein
MEVSTEQILSEMSSTPEATGGAVDAAPAQAQPQGPWWQDKLKEPVEYVTEGGKKVSEPFEMLMKRAGLGYHAAQRLHEVNSKAEQYAKLDARVKELQQWEEYDKYAKENPQWHEHLQKTWEERQALGQQQPQTNAELEALKKELLETKNFINELRQEKTKEKQAAEDKQFLDEISEVSKSFGVDLDQADENGESLAWRVTKHMQAMGMDGSKKGHFTMAFKDYNFDNLVGRQKEQAVEKHAKSQAELKKAGIREITRTPKGDPSFNGYKPGMSSRQLEQEALEYLQSLRKA